jgi:hypothetical protein
VPLEAVAELRRCPGPGAALPLSFLKHSDEQTVAGLAAVYHAIDEHGLGRTSFADWSVLGGPCALGRPTLASALQKFLEEGAWGVSPHLIPHRSLHSLSGTISHALKIHGANFGVGGGLTSPAEALLAASAMLGLGRAPGIWVVLTSFEPDGVAPDRTGNLPPDTHLLGVALALMPSHPEWTGPRLHFRAGEPTALMAPPLDLPRLAGLLDRLQGPLPGSLACELASGARLELQWPATRTALAIRRDGAGFLRPPHLPVAVETER